MSEGEQTKPVTAQQAIEDFFFEMLPPQSELPDKLKNDAPEPLKVGKARHKATSSVEKEKVAAPQAPATKTAYPLISPVEENLSIAALKKVQPEEADIEIRVPPEADLLNQSLAAMDEIFYCRQIEVEQEKQEKEKQEQDRLDQQRLERERREQEQLDQQRLERERREQEQLDQQRLELERREQEQLDLQRLERERREQEQLKQQRSEQEQLEKQQLAWASSLSAPASDLVTRPSIAAQRYEARRLQATQLNEQEPLFRQPVSLEDKLLQARLASVIEPSAVKQKISSKPVLLRETEPAKEKAEQPLIARPEVLETTSVEVTKEVALEAEPPDPWLDSGRPQWADGRFQILLFSVAGLKMAVPLVCLGSIHPLIEDLTPLVGRAPWFMGLMPIHEHNMRIVDTALWVMPERYQDGIRENYRYAINLADSDWALACDTVAQAITLEPEAVRWRTERSKRPWLAGTIVEHMCALMDVNMLRYMLHQQAKVRQASKPQLPSQSPQKSRIPGQERPGRRK